MKQIITILFLTFSHSLFSQDLQLEKNSNWKKYKKIIETNFENNATIEYSLEYGNIKSIKHYSNDSPTETKLIEENKINVKDSIRNIYNSNNLLEFDGEFNYFYNNENQLIQKRDFETLFLIQYFYNENGLLKREIGTDVKSTNNHIIEYKYDKCSNLLEEKEEETGKSMRGYLFNPSVVTYNYKYNNKNCIWTKKYIIINGNKKLIKKRVLE